MAVVPVKVIRLYARLLLLPMRPAGAGYAHNRRLNGIVPGDGIRSVQHH